MANAIKPQFFLLVGPYPDGKRNETFVFVAYTGLIRMANAIEPLLFVIRAISGWQTQENQCFLADPDGKRKKTNVLFCLFGLYPDGKRKKTNASLCFVAYPDGRHKKTIVFVCLFGPIRMANAIKPTLFLFIRMVNATKQMFVLLIRALSGLQTQ